MKATTAILLSLGLATAGSLAYSKSTGNALSKNGTVKRFLINPEGDVDGLLLDDGSQVNFPPHMSTQLTAVVAPKDKVEIQGFQENAKVFKAETIKNMKTAKSVTETPPEPPGDRKAGGPPPPPHDGPKGPPHGPRREGLAQMSAQGKVETQIFGRRGEVHGVILSDNTIVHFGPRLLSETNVKTDVGQTVKAAGFGSENSYGKVLEATELSNQ